jgi:hypothetical protein
MANSKYPAFVRILYKTPFAPHVQEVCTRAWSPDAGTNGSFNSWNDNPVDAATMINAFIAAEKEFYGAGTNFYGWEIWQYPDVDSAPLIVSTANIDVDGTSAAGAENKATQATWSFRTLAGGLFKVVNLDVEVTDFEKVLSASLSGDEAAFIAEIVDDDNAWSGRDNSQPTLFRQIAYTMNEKLRRLYHQN